MSKKISFGPYSFEVTNPDKVLFPTSGITKGEVIEYYRRIADVMLPHLHKRPLMMHRFPDGINEAGFYQKEVSDHFPEWIDRIQVETREGKEVTHVVCENAATLAYLAQEATITPHAWLSLVGDLEKPNRMIFDLDPPDGDFDLVLRVSLMIKEKLEHLGLNAFVMTTGSRGLHVVSPLRPEADFEKVRGFAREVADRLADEYPDELTTKHYKSKRVGRLYLDTNRNAYGQTGVCPYSLRALESGPVAAPVTWDEVEYKEIGPRTFGIGNVFRRLGQKDDPWKNINRHAVSLKGSLGKLG